MLGRVRQLVHSKSIPETDIFSLTVAGSIHLYSQTPLLKRAILLSGLAGLLPPRPISAQNEIYKDTLEKLGLNKIPDSERVGRFLHINAAELGKIAFKVEICPTSDGKIVPTTEWLRYEGFGPLPEWCQSIVIGSCKDEVSSLMMLPRIGVLLPKTRPDTVVGHATGWWN